MYLAGKFARRHVWQTVAAATAGAALIVAVIAAGVWHAWTEEQVARRKANAHEYGARITTVEAALQMNDAATARRVLAGIDDAQRGWEWRHLDARLDQSVQRWSVPSDAVGAAALDSNCRRLAVVTALGEVQVCAIDAGDPAGTAGQFQSIAGPELIPSDVVDTVSETLGRDDVRPRWWPSQLAFSDDATLLAVHLVATPDAFPHAIRVCALDHGATWTTVTRSLPKDSGSLAFQPGGRLLAIGMPGSVGLWEFPAQGSDNVEPVGTPRALGELRFVPATGKLRGSVFSGDGRYLAARMLEDNVVLLWDVAAFLAGGSAEPAAVLCGHTYHVWSLAFSRDGRWLASGSIDRTIRIWDVQACLQQARGTPERVVSGPPGEVDTLDNHNAGVLAVAFDFTGRHLISAGDDRLVHVADLRERAPMRDESGTYAWDATSWRQSNVLRGHQDRVQTVAALPDGRVLSVDYGGEVKVWDTTVADVARLEGHGSSVCAVGFPPDGSWLAAGDGDSTFILWDPEECLPLSRRKLDEHRAIRDLATWSRAGHRYLAVACTVNAAGRGDALVSLWDVDDPRQPRRLDQFFLQTRSAVDNGSWAVAVGDSGHRLAAGDSSGTVHLWDVTDGTLRELHHWHVCDGPVGPLVFLDAEGRWLAFAAAADSYDLPVCDTAIHVWDSEQGRETSGSPIRGHDDVIRSLALDPRGGRLASASNDRTIGLWSFDPGDDPPVLRPLCTLRGHTDEVIGVAFHPTEPRLASGGADRTIRLWNLDALVEVGILHGPVGAIADLAFDPRGERLAAASAGSFGSDNVVWLFETSMPPELRCRTGKNMWASREVRELVRGATGTLDEVCASLPMFAERFGWPDGVLEAAEEHFDTFVSRPDWLYNSARLVADDPDAGPTEREQARHWAQLGLTIAPWDEEAQALLTALQD